MLENIKKLSMVLGAVVLMVSCSKDMEDVNPSSTLSGVSVDAAKTASSTNPLTISDLSTTDGKTWMFTVQKTAVGNVPNIGSLLMILTDCDDQPIILSKSDVVSASIAGKTLQISDKEGNGSACDMTAETGYVRLTDFLVKATDGNVHTVSITLNDAVRVKSAKIWTRIGNDCYTTLVDGPGCIVEEDFCGEGQGFFHKSEHWGNIASVTIGGHTYTAAEAVTLITSDKKEAGNDNRGGIADSKAAFAQGVTVLLNRQLTWISSNAFEAELTAIEAYLSSLNKLTTYDSEDMPTGNAAAKAAAGAIGKAIDCKEAE